MTIVMKEISPKSKRHLKFEDVQVGDIFSLPNDNMWWFKTIEMEADCGKINAVNLEGDMDFFSEDEDVRKLKRNLMVEFSSDDLIEWV